MMPLPELPDIVLLPIVAFPYRTLKQRGLDPLDATVEALRTYTQTGILPPLPEMAKNTS